MEGGVGGGGDQTTKAATWVFILLTKNKRLKSCRVVVPGKYTIYTFAQQKVSILCPARNTHWLRRGLLRSLCPPDTHWMMRRRAAAQCTVWVQ